MLDRYVRPWMDPPLDRLGQRLARAGATADGVTLLGLALGVASAGAIALGAFALGLGLLLASRLADGLDGAIARATSKTDFGGYLDITADFLVYGAIPLGFVLHDPDANGAAGALLLASFYFNGATFLGYAILAEKRGLQTQTHGAKTVYFTGGLLEGTETIAFFAVVCLWPSLFAPLAWVFGGLCFVTGVSRVLLARANFRN